MEDETLIRRQMEESRTALSDKLETLESRVVDTVHDAATAVTDTVANIRDTVSSVRESVEETVSAVKGSMEDGVATVKDWMDVRAHVEHHPWAMTGGAVVAGFLLGKLFDKPAAPAAPPRGHADEGPRNGHRVPAASSMRPKRPAEKSALQSYLGDFGPELDQLKGLALGTLFGTARELLVNALPVQLGDKVTEIVDNVTKKVGGQPLSSIDWGGGPSSNQGDAYDQRDEAKVGGPLGATHRQGQENLGKSNRR